MTGIYKAKKCGVQFNPPCVILVYEDTLSCKLRRRSMPVRNFSSTSDVVPAARLIKDRHKRYLEPVSQIIIEKMLRLIQENMKGHDLEWSLLKVEKEYDVNPEEDLNKLDNEELEKKKAIMDITFNKGRIRPGDSKFEYDKRVDYAPDKPSDWDSHDGDSEESAYPAIPVLEDFQAEASTHQEDDALKDQHQESQLDISEEIIDAAEGNEEDSLEDKDPKMNVQFDIKDLENELKVDDLDDFWS